MKRTLALIAAGLLALAFSGCPDEKTADEVGGAPKRTLDGVEKRLDTATTEAAERLEKAAGAGE